MTPWFFLILSFFLGSIPFGWLIGRYYLKIDVRTQGSKNIGATNLARIGGKGPGLVTFLLDFGKAYGAVEITKHFWDPASPHDLNHWLPIIGITAVCGHIFSVFMKFRGGKGVAPTFGMLASLYWTVGLAAAAIWYLTFRWTRTSSTAALVLLINLPLLVAIQSWWQTGKFSWYPSLLFLGLSLLMIYRHKDNIQRIIDGTEGRFKK